MTQDYSPNHEKLKRWQPICDNLKAVRKGSSVSKLAKYLGLDAPCDVKTKEFMELKSRKQIEKESKEDPLIQDLYFEDIVKEKGITDDSYKDDITWNIADDAMLIDYIPKMEAILNKTKIKYQKLQSTFEKYNKVYEEQKKLAAESLKALDDIVDKTASKAAALETIRGLCIMNSNQFNWKLYKQYIIDKNECKTPWGSRNCIAFKKQQTKQYTKIEHNSRSPNLAALVSPRHNIQHIDNTNIYGGSLCNDVLDYLTRNEALTDTNIFKSLIEPYQMYKEPTIYTKGNGLIKQSQLLRIQMFGPDFGHPTHSALNGQFGVKAIQNFPRGTILGEYKGVYFMNKEFTMLWNEKCIDYNMCMIDGFDLFLYTPSSNIKKQDKHSHIVLNTSNSYYQAFQFASYINDPRKDFYEKKVVNKEDMKYWNVDFVVYYINGWPRVFIIAKRDVAADEELMGYYNGSINDASHQFWKGINLKEKYHFKYKLRRIARGIDMMPFPPQVIKNLLRNEDVSKQTQSKKDNIMDDDIDHGIGNEELTRKFDDDLDIEMDVDINNDTSNKNISEMQMALKASIESKEQDDINMAIRSSMNEQENKECVVGTGEDDHNHNKKNEVVRKNETLPEYVKYWDDKQQRWYWYNIKTQISQWNSPDDDDDDDDDDDEIEFDEMDKLLLPEGWYKYYNEDNIPYYYNTETKKRQWEVPVELTNSSVDNDEVQTIEESLDKIIAEKKKKVSDKMEMDADEEEIEREIERVTKAAKKKQTNYLMYNTQSNDNRSREVIQNDAVQSDDEDIDMDTDLILGMDMIPNPVLPSPPDP